MAAEERNLVLTDLFPDIYVPSFGISVAGRPLEPIIARRIFQVTVIEHMDPPNEFSLQLYDPDLELIDGTRGRLREGQIVEVSLGYVGGMRKLIVGRIAALSADFPSNGPPTVDVRGFDLLHDLTHVSYYRVFEGSKPGSGPPDSQVVSTVAREMGLTASVGPENPNASINQEQRVPRIQDHLTNFEFLSDLAAVHNYALWVDDHTLHFKPSRTAGIGPGAVPIRLTRGKNLVSFSPHLTTAGQFKAIEVRGWDPQQKQAFSVRAERESGGDPGLPSGDGNSVRVVDGSRVSSPAEAAELAKRLLGQQMHSATSGSGMCQGMPELCVGSTVELRNVGRFDGHYVVSQVTHSVGEGGYQTSFEVSGGAEGGAALSMHSGRLGPGRLAGVVPALVESNKDPDGQGRVQVRLPGSSEDAKTWARMATFMAGPSRGALFLPERGDEVLVAFERGDVARPYVLGGLWNGRDAPPDTNADGKNNLRLIKSRSGHIVRLDDTENKEKIEIIDKTGDSHITFDVAANTLTIHSAGDVVIEAPDGTLRLSGSTVEIHSTGDAKLSADAALDLRGEGDTTLKGATVNIN